MRPNLQDLLDAGCPEGAARALHLRLQELAAHDPPSRWQRLVATVLTPHLPFAVHALIHEAVFARWDRETHGPAPAWFPRDEEARASNAGRLIAELGLTSFRELHGWAATHRADYWARVLEHVGLPLDAPFEAVVDLSGGPERPRWLPGARLNIAAACRLDERDRPAIVTRREGERALRRLSAGELDDLARRVARGLRAIGIGPGDGVGVVLPLTAEAVAVYLGVVRLGAVVVSIADSFAAPELRARLTLGAAKACVTQDVLRRGGREHALYPRVVAAGAPRAVVLSGGDGPAAPTREGDLAWDDFLAGGDDLPDEPPRACAPDDPSNLLFSSGTTGAPKAVPWTHTTPLKCIADAWLHHDVRPGDVLAWPTNLGWMMGPWLIYAALGNRAALALHEGAPTGPDFCRFVEEAGVTLLGVVPGLVRAWREGDATRGCDWRRLRAFSSTGECSHPGDMLWLMSRAAYRPVIEYCGGTEVGGGYVTGSLLQPQAPGTFSTPALGLDLVVLDEAGRPTDQGEAFIVPPSIGLSTTLVGRDHHAEYFEGAPPGPGGVPLRRHGDHLEVLAGGYYRAHGRVDDTMNLGGIKVSSAELERVLTAAEGVRETAAVAAPGPGGGPARLVVFAVLQAPAAPDPEALRRAMQDALRDELNPLFRLDEVVVVPELPRTASGKVVRRELRARLTGSSS